MITGTECMILKTIFWKISCANWPFKHLGLKTYFFFRFIIIIITIIIIIINIIKIISSSIIIMLFFVLRKLPKRPLHG